MSSSIVDNSLPHVQFDRRGERCQSSTPIVSIIMHSRGRPELFRTALQSLINTCTAVGEVEILMKVDSDDSTISRYLEILCESPFHFKLLTYDRLDAYWSVHVFQNDISKLANGSVLWCFNEDNEIVGGDWARAFRETRNVYPDNIYVVKVPGHPPRTYKTVAPAYSKEWFKVLGMVSPHIFSDRFLCNMAVSVNRFLSTHQVRQIQFRHRHLEKIGRPRINLNHKAMTKNLEQRLAQLRPYYLEAIKEKA